MAEDLSALAADSMWTVSMAGGNRQSSNERAMTASGSQPVDPEIDAEHQADPTVTTADYNGRHLAASNGDGNDPPNWSRHANGDPYAGPEPSYGNAPLSIWRQV
jgi:hypothetical protein